MQRIRAWWRKLPSLPAAREVAILVAGILIAFALDAWWEQRSTAERERAHLRALTSDFQQNAERLERMIELQDRIAESSRELLVLAPRSEAVPVDSIQRLLGLVYTSNRFEPVMGAYEGLENSAEVALLRDDSLRASLAAFAAQLDLRHSERLSDEIFLDLIREFAGELPLLAPFVLGEEHPVRLHQASRELLPTPKFQEYLALRHIAAHDVANDYRRLAGQTRTILARLARLSE